MNNEISDAIVLNTSKIEVFLSKSGLRANVLDKKGDNLYSGSISMTHMHKILDKLCEKKSKNLTELISLGIVVVDKNVYDYYKVDNKSFSKIFVLSKEQITALNIKSVKSFNVFLNNSGLLNGTIILDDGKVFRLDDLASINAMLDVFYANGFNNGFNLLYPRGPLKIDDKVYSEYEIIDSKYFSQMNKVNDKTDLDVKSSPTKSIDNVFIDLKEGKLRAIVTYDDDTESELTDIDKINELITAISTKESKSLKDLINDGIVAIDDEVMKKYEIKDNKSISLITKESGTTKEDDSPKKEGKIKLRKINKRAIAWFMALSLAGTGLVAWISSLKNDNNNNSTGPKVDPYHDDVDENLIEHTTLYGSPSEYVDYDVEGLGSEVNEDMIIQLDSITNAALTQKVPYAFENLVVDDDKVAIGAFSSYRKNILESRDNLRQFEVKAKDFLDSIVKYVIDNGTSVNGQFIEPYSNLHPYAKFIIIRMSQGMLQEYKRLTGQNYKIQYERINQGGFIIVEADENILVPLYDKDGDELFNILTSNRKSK